LKPAHHQKWWAVALNNTIQKHAVPQLFKFVAGKKGEHNMSQQESAVIANTPTIDESNWRQELEQLDRLLTGRLTESEAKEYAKSELSKHDGVVNTIETEIAQARAVAASATATSYLSVGDRKRIADKIESLESQLDDARRLRERSIRLNGAGIKAAKECDKQRPRWLELRKRERDIEAARSIGRGKGEPEIAIGIPRRWQ
jgi:hypothetical protein